MSKRSGNYGYEKRQKELKRKKKKEEKLLKRQKASEEKDADPMEGPAGIEDAVRDTD